MLYSWDHLNKIGPIKNNRLSVQIEYYSWYYKSANYGTDLQNKTRYHV